MKGVKYAVDGNGQAQTVLIDLKTHGQLWERFHDARHRTPWFHVVRRLKKRAKARAKIST